MSVELLSRAERGRLRYVSKATAPGNSTLNRRTQPNARAIHCRLGYNTIAATYSPGAEIARLSGSSLNRAHAKKVRDEKTQIFQTLEEIKKKNSRFDPELAESIRETELLREAVYNKSIDKSKFSRMAKERGDSLHFLSQRTKGKLRDKCTAFHRCLGTRKTFVTLTFISDVTDSDGVAILNKFLTMLRSMFSKIHYVWVAERQEIGRIHFHLIINKYLPVVRFNALWTRQQYNAGLTNGETSLDEILSMKDKEVQKKFNSFDVKKIRHINGLSYYLTKYITKNKNEGFKCSAWHCSRAVSRIFIKTLVPRSSFLSAASMVNCTLDKKTGEVKKTPAVVGRYHCLYYIENKKYFLPEMSELETVNRWIVDGMLPDRLPEVDDAHILKLYSN